MHVLENPWPSHSRNEEQVELLRERELQRSSREVALASERRSTSSSTLPAATAFIVQ